MFSYNARVPADQQLQLIMECRNSGLSDYQWCKEHGIHPGTFYNWVSRLRRKACCEIPESISKAEPSPTPAQEVVRLNVHSKAANPDASMPVGACESNLYCRYFCQHRNISGQCDNPHRQWN